MRNPNILRNKKDFSMIYNKGKSVGSKYVVLFFKRNNLGYNRIAFLASKKVGNSVHRNRARRLMKESFREINDNIKQSYDIIMIARNTINDKKYKDVIKSLKDAFFRAKLFKSEEKGN